MPSAVAAMIEKDAGYQTAHVPARLNGAARVSAPEVVDRIPNIDHRFGDGRAEILGIAITDDDGNEVSMLNPATAIVVRISVVSKSEVRQPVIGFMLRNHLGVDFAGTNTARESVELPPMSAVDIYTVDFHVEIPTLYASTFSFSPAIADGTLHQYAMCDWIDNAIALPMARSEAQIYGQMHLPCRVEVNARLAGRTTSQETYS